MLGDLRQLLAVSSRLAGVPYVNVLDPHWSPYARTRFELAEHWLADRLGYNLAQGLFALLYPFGSVAHTLPFNRVSIERGLPPLSLDIRRAYAFADQILYPSVPELVPTYRRPDNHAYMGPIVWSPEVPQPAWWSALPADVPSVYVGLGTTGQVALLSTLLRALADLPVVVIAATAGRMRIADPPRNAFVAPYLPGTAAARRSQLVVCNGGTMSTQQALAAGAPVVQWEIEAPDGRVHVWHNVVGDGHFSALAGTAVRCDVAFRADLLGFLRVVAGLMKGVDAVSLGILKLDGDLDVAVQMQTWFAPLSES